MAVSPITFIKKHPIVIPIFTFGCVSLVFFFVSPDTIISYVGVENSYLLIGILAFLGGITTFSGIPYHLILVTLAAGGLNPWLLGLTATGGVILGDSSSYYLGYYGKALIPDSLVKWLDRLGRIYRKNPRFMPILFLVYGSISPFSNDVITIPMGVLRYPFFRVMIPLGLGNAIFNISLALLAVYAYDYVSFLI